VADEGIARPFWRSVGNIKSEWPNALILVFVCVCVCVCFPKVNFFSYAQMAWRALASLEQSNGALVIVSSLLGTSATSY